MPGAWPSSDMKMSVAWGDCDAAGIHYYARTFDWFTNARLHFLASNGFAYMDTFHHAGISLVCLTADSRFTKMLRPEEEITIRTSLTALTRTRLAFGYQILKNSGETAAEGSTTHAYVDPDGVPFNLKKRHPQLWDWLIGKWPAFQD